MSYQSLEIKEGIKAHIIKTNKFKTNLISVFLTVPLSRDTVTLNALIPAVLRRGTANLKNQEEISKELEDMYGAMFDCGIEKSGDNQVIKFYLETINDEFLPNDEETLKRGTNLLFDIVFNPLIENACFKKTYVESEKDNLKKIIESKIDNKDRYAFDRCIEEMYKDKIYSIYKYGYVEDLEKINEILLFEQYQKLIRTSKIDIFLSGDINENDAIELIRKNKNICNLKERKDIHVIPNSININQKNDAMPKVIEEKMDVTQGKIVIGMDVNLDEENSQYKTSLYSVILGESATSKLFQNVREKESLAYTIRSNFLRQKKNIFIRGGIEVNNYEKAIRVIKVQLEDMTKGNFSDEDIENAKKYIIAGLNTTKEEQDSEISYYFGQELSKEFTTFDEYEKQIKIITKNDIINVANSTNINTIYFLRN